MKKPPDPSCIPFLTQRTASSSSFSDLQSPSPFPVTFTSLPLSSISWIYALDLFGSVPPSSSPNCDLHHCSVSANSQFPHEWVFQDVDFLAPSYNHVILAVKPVRFLPGSEACEVQICKFGSVWCARVFVSNTALIESIPSEHKKVKLQSAVDYNAIRHHDTQISLLFFSSSFHHPFFCANLPKFILAYLSDDDTKVYVLEPGPRLKKEPTLEVNSEYDQLPFLCQVWSRLCVIYHQPCYSIFQKCYSIMNGLDFLVYDVWAMLNIKSDYYNSCDAKGIYCVICQSWLRIKRLNLSTFKHHNHPPYLYIWSNEMSFSFCALREMKIDSFISTAAFLTTKWKVQLFQANSSIMALLFDIETAMVREVHDESSLSCASKALLQATFGPRQICMIIWLCMEVIIERHKKVFSLHMYYLVYFVKCT
ncbi:hypothetical protein Cgig2_013461 [Carnegiea gigantea]|uniref:Uncharacterized protein n=1 Tax=Carnegiea gigantea TaxID=171969 RepID=A0A9Q1K4T0_9CARY|nr:hypothetical protein Cgig2_013461 [Carnegiea gigantea]